MVTLRDQVIRHRYMILCFIVGATVSTFAFCYGGFLTFTLGFLIAMRIGDVE